MAAACPECGAALLPPNYYAHRPGCAYAERRDYVLTPPRLWRAAIVGLALEAAAALLIYAAWRYFR